MSCKSDIKEDKKEIVHTSGILTEYMDISVKPGDDFTALVNGT
ncbi:hypothetical protein [Maribacter antarcticus]|nr:hypothetical protein [Maribacter antarcticus]